MHGFFYGVCLGHRAFRFKSSFLWAFHCNHSRKNFEDFSWILRQYLFPLQVLAHSSLWTFRFYPSRKRKNNA